MKVPEVRAHPGEPRRIGIPYDSAVLLDLRARLVGQVLPAEPKPAQSGAAL
jgi:hypothetical protein